MQTSDITIFSSQRFTFHFLILKFKICKTVKGHPVLYGYDTRDLAVSWKKEQTEDEVGQSAGRLF